jgi:hypothetical protein
MDKMPEHLIPRDKSRKTLGPPGVLPSEEAVLALYGPEPIHEAQAIVDALTKLLGKEKGSGRRLGASGVSR